MAEHTGAVGDTAETAGGEAVEEPTEEERDERDRDAERRISQAMLELRKRTPFFYTLAFFARVRFLDARDDDPFAFRTAATDGRDIFWNRDFLMKLSAPEVVGVLLHEVLHAALLHVPRRGSRDPLLWNLAADIVVNGMVDEADKKAREGAGQNARPVFALPEGGVRDPKHAHLSVEEVYELLQAKVIKIKHELTWQDLLDGPPGGRENPDGLDGAARHAALEAHWRAARAQAEALARGTGRGDMPAGMRREFSMLQPAQVDWRARLWRFLVRTPTDFSGFDRRFIGRGLYLEALEGESLKICVGIDTSGSIGEEDLGQFLGEVQGILRSYPHLTCYLYYVDAEAHGPFRLTGDSDTSAFPRPIGGGGTDFRPFFEAVDRDIASDPDAAVAHALGGVGPIAVYLTDGMGAFPDAAPPYPVLWICTPGGIDLEQFPFGEAVRLILSR